MKHFASVKCHPTAALVTGTHICTGDGGSCARDFVKNHNSFGRDMRQTFLGRLGEVEGERSPESWGC